MRRFAQLFAELDQTNKTNEKVESLAKFFREADAASAAWGLYFLSDRKLRRLVTSTLLRQWAMEDANIEAWLFDECYEAVGDLGETISLIVPRPTELRERQTLAEWVEKRLVRLRQLTVAEQKQEILRGWRELDQTACLVFNKLLTGSFRVGVSQKLVVRGLSEASGIDADVLAHRLMGQWEPSAEFYVGLLHPDATDAVQSRPYPFFLANPLESLPEDLGPIQQWQAEWKWDGIRAQVIKRGAEVFLWSRGEDLMQGRFPELEEVAALLPDGTVLDGEIVGFRDGEILPFAHLQRRIGRKEVGKKLLRDVPVAFLMFDVLEWQGRDIRGEPLVERRGKLEQLAALIASQHTSVAEKRQSAGWLDLGSTLDREANTEGGQGSERGQGGNGGQGLFRLPPLVQADSWAELAEIRREARSQHAEGLMLKRLESPYQVGRPRGDWWKWKIEPYTIDAVLIYAQRGHGKRASLYTDYTFGVWDGGTLVPFAKAYSGLTDKEIAQVDRFVRQNTVERFGPVRSVTPQLVFELAFENIQLSTRHKSGIAVRFPRILRWRDDKSISQADSLETIRSMLRGQA